MMADDDITTTACDSCSEQAPVQDMQECDSCGARHVCEECITHVGTCEEDALAVCKDHV